MCVCVRMNHVHTNNANNNFDPIIVVHLNVCVYGEGKREDTNTTTWALGGNWSRALFSVCVFSVLYFENVIKLQVN